MFRLTLLWLISLLIYVFISFFYSFFVIFMYRSFLLISHFELGEMKHSRRGEEEKGKPGTHPTWSFWFIYQNTCKYASPYFSNPINNLPELVLFFIPAGASLLSSPLEILKRPRAQQVPIWSFDIISLCALRHLPGPRGKV